MLKVMALRQDMGLLFRVSLDYEELLNKRIGVSVVDVTTTVSLDDSLRQAIVKKAESELGVSVVLREHIDKSILGGIVMNAQGQRLDASIKTQLENARRVLKKQQMEVNARD
jgi:F-type H+-transporting ATPase subunit delta